MTSKYTNKNGVKLLVAVLAFAMVACALVITTPDANAEEAVADPSVKTEKSVASLTVDETVTYYDSLVGAVAAAPSEKNSTITLLKDSAGNGVKIVEENKTIVFDFAGFTYTVGEPVGSPGTVSQGFHIEKTNTITMKNGTIANSGKVSMLFQNYCDLTLIDMKLDGTKMSAGYDVVTGEKVCNYTLSLNNGSVSILGNTQIIADEGQIAFDVCWGPKVGYPNGTQVTLNTTGSIDGDIMIDDWGTSDNKSLSKLTILSGIINGDVLFISQYGTPVSIADTVKVDVIIPEGTTATGSVTFGKDTVTFTSLKAGEDGIKFSKGSVVISGTIDATSEVSIDANGTVKLDGVEVTGTSTNGLTVSTTGVGSDIIIEDLTLGANSKLTLSNNTKVTVTGSLDATATGATITAPESATLEADSTATISGEKTLPITYVEGSVLNYNGVDYTVFKTTWAGKDIYYGISCGNIVYVQNKVIDEYDIDVLSICITNGYKLTNQTYVLEDITVIPEDQRPGDKYSNAGTYKNALKIQITFNETTTGDAFTANKKIDLVILPAVPDVDFSIDAPASETTDYEWNMYNTVITDDKITYTYNGVEYTFGIDAPLGVTVTYTIKDSTDAIVEKDISELGKGTYKIALSFTEYGNYAATTTTEKTIKVTDTPDESKIIFKDIDAEADLLGKVASQLQEGVEFVVGEKSGDKYPVKFSGQFIKVTDYTGFSSIVGEQTGYYLAFSIDMTKVTEKTTLKITKNGIAKEFTGAQLDGDFVIFLGNPGTFSATSLNSFEMEIDYDGSEGKYSPGIYTVSADDTAGKVSEITMVIELEDKFINDIIKITTSPEYIILPNGAGTENEFVGWMDENNEVRAAGSILVITDALDKDGNLRIELKAVYKTPVEPETPTYTVSFVYGTDVIVKNVKAGETVTAPEITVPEGYKLIGWFNGDVEFDPASEINADAIYVAVIEAIPVEPEVPTPSTGFDVYAKEVDGMVQVRIISQDGYLEDGELVVSMSYTYYDDFAGDYMTETVDSDPISFTSDGETTDYTLEIEIPTDFAYYAASAVFISGDLKDETGAIFI